MSDTITTYEVLLRTDPQDGNDPIEAVAHLPIIPRAGDVIETWDSQGGMMQRNRQGEVVPSGTEKWLEVDHVIFCSYAPERVEVWVKVDSYDLDEVKRIMEAVDKNEQP
jgi:hypothetical protein